MNRISKKIIYLRIRLLGYALILRAFTVNAFYLNRHLLACATSLKYVDHTPNPVFTLATFSTL